MRKKGREQGRKGRNKGREGSYVGLQIWVVFIAAWFAHHFVYFQVTSSDLHPAKKTARQKAAGKGVLSSTSDSDELP